MDIKNKTAVAADKAKSSKLQQNSVKSSDTKPSLHAAINSSSTSSLNKSKSTRPVKIAEGKEKQSVSKVAKTKTSSPKELDITLQRSGTKTIMRENEANKEQIDSVLANNNHEDSPTIEDSLNNEQKFETEDGNNNTIKNLKTSDSMETFITTLETSDTNLTQVLSNISTCISSQEEATTNIVPSTSNSDLIDVIDQEAEVRRRESSSRKHREMRKSAEHTAIDESTANSNVDVSTVEGIDPPKSSRPKKSLNNQSASSTDELQEKANKKIVVQKSVDEVPSTPFIRPRTSLRPPSVRPASARPGAPRRRDKNVEIFLQPEDSVQMVGMNVKVDKILEVDLDDDGDNLIVIEDPMIGVGEDSNKAEFVGNDMELGKSSDDTTTAGSLELNGDQQHGHLVQQILQTQKDLTKPDENDIDLVLILLYNLFTNYNNNFVF